MKSEIKILSKEEFLRLCKEETPSNVDRNVVREVYEAICKVTVDQLKQQNGVQIHGLGTFVPSIKESHEARNPSTGEMVVVPDRLNVKFKINANFKVALKNIDLNKKTKNTPKKASKR